MSTANGRQMAYGCMFCRTGNEKQLATILMRDYPGIHVIAAEKLRRRRQGKRLIEETVMLFPGYLFFQADADFSVKGFAVKEDVYKVLFSSGGQWQLCGEDADFAQKLFAQEGIIGFSKAYFEGDRIRVTEGMLKQYEGRILRVNRRAQTAQVSIGVCGQEVTVWLGFELIENNNFKDRMADGAYTVSANEGD